MIGGKEPVENCVVETCTRYLPPMSFSPLFARWLRGTRMNEANVKRNETKERGEEGWEGEGKERKRSERKSEANVLPNGVSISIMTALFPFGLVRAPHGYVYTQGDRVDANNWRSSILSVGIAHSETSFASAFVHPERESTDTRARLLSLFSFSLSLSLFLYLCFSASKRGGAMRVSIHAR